MQAAVLAALVCAAALAGCASNSAPPDDPLDVGLGQARMAGVVVDEAIRPIAAATIHVVDADLEAATDGDGAFQLAVPVGERVVEVRHPTFAPVRQTVAVPAHGVEGLVLRLTLAASEAPYSAITKYDGFIVCSLGVSLIFSEECGEGVGTPVGRLGRQGGNAIRYDFEAESPSLKTIVVEQVWEPTSDAGRELLVLFSTAWTCEPACGGNAVGEGSMQGASPLLLRVDEDELADHLKDPATVFTTYTLADNNVVEVNVVLNQAFQLFVTQFYREAAPEGYSFVAGP
ncbi:MAG: carboxypeptidase-like regulatory domain-containing protein [Candidatus Thermoplasmatota archaeon]